MDTNTQVLTAARDAWLAASSLRARRQRYKRYTYGDQWSDIVTDPSGRCFTEADLIAQSGHKPLINNMIRQIVKTVIGRFRHSQSTEQNPGESHRDSDAAHLSLLELDCRLLEEFLISGCAIQRIARESRQGISRLWIDNISPDAFFVNPFRDPRGHDIHLIGALHDLSLPDIIHRFARGSSQRAAALERTYARLAADPSLPPSVQLGEENPAATSFFTPPPGRCRAIEVWTLDARPAPGSPRPNSASLRFYWHVRWFAPDGTLLMSSPSQAPHRSHPFALKFYPLTDGEVHSFVEDVIDQQRCINRMIVLIDHIIGSSAKGVLLFPQDQKPKNVDWADIASTWALSSGVIPITGTGQHLPQQVISPGGDAGAYQLLALQMKLFDNISGVGPALAGRTVAPSTGSAVYESQIRNSTIALADLLDTFSAFRTLRNQKAAQS